MTMKDHNEENEVRKDAPMLFGIPKQDPFAVEEGFFERFPHQVQALASQRSRTPRLIWMKRAALALPALALVIFAVHSLRAPNDPDVAAYTPDEALQYATSEQFDTQTIMADATEAEWPVFDSVTVQLTPNEALAYVDQHDIDLTDYLHQQ
jgi:hypothetical protein